MASLAPLVTEIESDLQFSHAAMGSVMGAWQFVYIFAAVPCGMLLDRLGGKWGLAAGAVIIAASGLLRGWATDYSDLLIAVALEVCGTMLLPVSQNFTRPVPTLSLIGCYAASFYCLTFALNTLPIEIGRAHV